MEELVRGLLVVSYADGSAYLVLDGGSQLAIAWACSLSLSLSRRQRFVAPVACRAAPPPRVCSPLDSDSSRHSIAPAAR